MMKPYRYVITCDAQLPWVCYTLKKPSEAEAIERAIRMAAGLPYKVEFFESGCNQPYYTLKQTAFSWETTRVLKM